MVKAIIFDLDGVLIDATGWHYFAMNKALALFGYTITPHEHENQYNGLPTRKKLEILSEKKGVPASLHDLMYDMKQVYTQEAIERFCRQDFQKVYMLMKLKERGYRLAVCSNAIRTTVETTLEKAGMLQFFEFVLSNEDVAIPKPDPQMYLEAFERLGLDPQECIIVEDSDHGKRSARASGGITLEVGGYEDVNYGLIDDFIKKIREG